MVNSKSLSKSNELSMGFERLLRLLLLGRENDNTNMRSVIAKRRENVWHIAQNL